MTSFHPPWTGKRRRKLAPSILNHLVKGMGIMIEASYVVAVDIEVSNGVIPSIDCVCIPLVE
jgi:uncharacterized surface protein with fasciclin (FAS1) repeats